MDFPVSTLIVAVVAFTLAGLVKGIVGLGLPTVSMAVLTFAVPVPQAQALLVLPALVTNVWQAVDGGRLKALLTRFWPFQVGVCAGVWLETLTGLHDHPRASAAFLGVVICLYAALGLAAIQMRIPRRHEGWLGLPIGVGGGVVLGATGVFVIPAVAYLQALDMKRDELVQALGLSFTVSSLALGIALADKGAFSLTDALVSIPALIAAMLGMQLGRRLRDLVSPATFRTILYFALLAIGLQLAVRNLF